MDRMKEEGSAGAAQGRQRNRPKTMPERMKQGMYSIGGQIEVKDRARANEMAKKGGTHLTHESLRQI
jgi:general stress protein YciG